MPSTFYSKYIKRFLDFIFSFIGLVILSPIFLVVAIAIKLESQGPVFFRQERLGKDGNIFKILKFRSMVENAENLGSGIKISTEEDTRITRVGKFLRKTGLDELPQLINIIRGEMSFIGPRPPVTYHPYLGYDSYPEKYKSRFSVLPGVTGLAQVEVRNSVPWAERFIYDLEYVSAISFKLDLKLLFRTFGVLNSSEKLYARKGRVDD